MVKVFFRLGQPEEMIDRDGRQKNSGYQQHGPPGARHVAGAPLKDAAQHHQQALSQHETAAVEGIAYAHERRLPLPVQGQHIVSVRGNVVRSRREGHQHEQHQQHRHRTERQAERDHRKHGHHCELSQQYPPALAPEDVHEGAPEGLDEPGQADESRQRAQSPVIDAQVLEDRQGYGIDYCIGQALDQIQGRDPRPRTAFAAHILSMFDPG